jgi:hypothetical protein
MIFTAVILAAQPMTFNELIDLLSVKVGEEPSSRRRRTRSVVLSACSPFVEVDYDSDFVNPTLRLVHKSIGDFLTQDPANLDFVTRNCYKFFVKYKEGNAEIGKRCLTYLSYRRYENSVNLGLDNDSSEHGLLKYASIFWHTHFQRAGPNKELFERMRDFMRSSNVWNCVRVQSKFAPHMFAKLSYISGTDTYRMGLHSARKSRGEEEFFADALPGWTGEYDDEGDALVWGYHMFVRDWGEVLLRNPDNIQQYFAKVLGERSFWNTHSASNELVDVKTAEDGTGIEHFLQLYEVGDDTMSTLTSQISSEDASSGSDMSECDYIKSVLQERGGEWRFHHSTRLSMGDWNATVYQYKFAVASSEVDDSDDSDEEIPDSGYDDDEKSSPATFEGTLWFLSVTAGEGDNHWYHHISKSNALQRSPPIFIPQKSWLIWPQDESSMLLLDLDTWTLSVSTFTSSDKTDAQLISQGRRSTTQLHRHQLTSV